VGPFLLRSYTPESMWLREQIGPQAYTVNSSILWLE